ncbi:MAG: EAL domain-containing protein, partial [Xanthobacteraceae bacterium]
YDGPLMGINHARLAHAELNAARLLRRTDLSERTSAGTVVQFHGLLADIAADLGVVRDRVKTEDVTAALSRAEDKVRDWSETALRILEPPPGGLTMVPVTFSVVQKEDDAVAALDDLVQTVAAYGFDYRVEAEAMVATVRATMVVLGLGAALVGLILAVAFANSMTRPIFAAMRIAERVAAGNFTDRIDVRRRDEPGRLLSSLAVMQASLKDRADADLVTMERISFLANQDPLTGLHNRARFIAKLDESIARLHECGVVFSVLMLDLDKFKNVNDTLGHSAGDDLLRQVAQRLRSSLRETDAVARLGGDEFAIIQPGTENQREAAIAFAIRLKEIFSRSFDLAGNTVNIGVSIGIVMAPESGHVPVASDLLRKADLALYRSKSDGRGRFTFFTDTMMLQADARRCMEIELREAIIRNEFELHYQPIIDVNSREICGVEALARWRHPIKGLVFPDQFIPLAEETGLIVQIGEWALGRACTDAATWPDNIRVAVNLSAVQFVKGDLFDVILCALAESGLDPGRLELEMTETVLLENEQEYRSTIEQLRNLGITLALDDFGIGFSSLSYLTRFPFDNIKIDRSFTQGCGERDASMAIVSSVVTLARGLDMVTTAEGVETVEQFNLLRVAGVTLAQGYLFGRPVPLSQLDFSRFSAVDDASGRAA